MENTNITRKLINGEELTKEEFEILCKRDSKIKFDNTKFNKYAKFNNIPYMNYLTLDFDYNDIDPLIQELIVNLNVAGLTTRYSCSGHIEENELAGYIFFEPTVCFEKLHTLFYVLNNLLVDNCELTKDQEGDRCLYTPDIKLELTPILDNGGRDVANVFRWNYAERYEGTCFVIDKDKVITNEKFLKLFNYAVFKTLMLIPPSIYNNEDVVKYYVNNREVSKAEFDVAEDKLNTILKEML